MYKFGRAVVNIVLKIFYSTRYKNAQNLPSEGGCIICGNHVSALDPLILACATKRECSFIAKAELFDNFFIRWVSKAFNIFPVKRGTGDIGAMKKAISLVNDGAMLVIFPEGTRSKNGKLGEGKNGATLIAKKTGCQIVPCAIQKAKIFAKTEVVFGEPYRLGEVKGSEALNLETEKLMEKISGLMEELN